MKLVEQIFQSPDGKLYAFDKATDDNYGLVAKSVGYATNTIAGPRSTLILNGWIILTSTDDNPGYEVEMHASSYELSELKDFIEQLVNNIASENGYMLRGNTCLSSILMGGVNID